MFGGFVFAFKNNLLFKINCLALMDLSRFYKKLKTELMLRRQKKS